MKLFLFLFSVIVLATSKPADIIEPYEEASGSVSSSAEDDSDVRTSVSTDEYSVPETFVLSPDEIRIRRNVQKYEINSTNSSEEQTSKSEERTEEPVKVPLRRLITAVEADLVTDALQINAQLRRRRSTPLSSAEDNTKENSTSSEHSDDVNKDLFEGLFNFTRPHRDTDEDNVKIPLNGLVQAVESTLVNSAKNLRDPKHLKQNDSSIEVEVTTAVDESHRINRDTDSQNDQHIELDLKDEPVIQVQKLDSSNSHQNLNILSPITFKPTAPETTTVSDESSATTVLPVHKTNVTNVQASNTISLIPCTDNKVAHVQHQAISKTVFHSNLAIFPTISPKTINAPLSHTTTAEDLTETTVAAQPLNAPKSEKDVKHDELLQQAEKLKEKFAEVQAKPVILSQLV